MRNLILKGCRSEVEYEEAEDHEVDLKDRVEELEARVAKLEEAVMFLLEGEDEVP